MPLRAWGSGNHGDVGAVPFQRSRRGRLGKGLTGGAHMLEGERGKWVSWAGSGAAGLVLSRVGPVAALFLF
jgi:hypothetical protein